EASDPAGMLESGCNQARRSRLAVRAGDRDDWNRAILGTNHQWSILVLRILRKHGFQLSNDVINITTFADGQLGRTFAKGASELALAPGEGNNDMAGFFHCTGVQLGDLYVD